MQVSDTQSIGCTSGTPKEDSTADAVKCSSSAVQRSTNRINISSEHNCKIQLTSATRKRDHSSRSPTPRLRNRPSRLSCTADRCKGAFTVLRDKAIPLSKNENFNSDSEGVSSPPPSKMMKICSHSVPHCSRDRRNPDPQTRSRTDPFTSKMTNSCPLTSGDIDENKSSNKFLISSLSELPTSKCQDPQSITTATLLKFPQVASSKNTFGGPPVNFETIGPDNNINNINNNNYNNINNITAARSTHLENSRSLQPIISISDDHSSDDGRPTSSSSAAFTPPEMCRTPARKPRGRSSGDKDSDSEECLRTPDAPLVGRYVTSLAAALRRNDVSAVMLALGVNSDGTAEPSPRNPARKTVDVDDCIFVDWAQFSSNSNSIEINNDSDSVLDYTVSLCGKTWLAPVSYAARYASPKIIALLLNAGASAKTKTLFGENLLVCLCAQPRPKAQLMISAGDDFDVRYPSLWKQSLPSRTWWPLAVFPSAPSKSVCFYSSDGSDGGSSSTPRAFLTMKSKTADIEVVPPSMDTDENAVGDVDNDDEQVTRRSWAETVCNLRIEELLITAELLVFYGVDPLETDSRGLAAIDYAEMFGHVEVLNLLKQILERKARREKRLKLTGQSRKAKKIKKNTTSQNIKLTDRRLMLTPVRASSRKNGDSPCGQHFNGSSSACLSESVPAAQDGSDLWCTPVRNFGDLLSPHSASASSSWLNDETTSLATCDTLGAKKSFRRVRKTIDGGSNCKKYNPISPGGQKSKHNKIDEFKKIKDQRNLFEVGSEVPVVVCSDVDSMSDVFESTNFISV